jgi:hypothetical protein
MGPETKPTTPAYILVYVPGVGYRLVYFQIPAPGEPIRPTPPPAETKPSEPAEPKPVEPTSRFGR